MKIETVASSLYFNAWTLRFYSERSVFQQESASRLRSIYCLKRSEDLVEKMNISGDIWHKSFIQMVKWSFFSQTIVHQSFYGVLLTFYNFFFKEKLCVSARRSRQVAREVFIV